MKTPDNSEGPWLDEHMGPLYHCMDDCEPDLMKYHILHNQFTRLMPEGKGMVISHTLSGHPIVLTLPDFHVLVIYQEEQRVGIAGDSWSDLMLRMIEERNNGPPNPTAAVEIPPLEISEIACSSCGDIITSQTSYSCSTCETVDLCERCHSDGVSIGSHDPTHEMTKIDGEQIERIVRDFKALTPYGFDPAPTPSQKVSNRLINDIRKSLPRSNLLYLKWDDSKFTEFPQLLSTDRRLNLETRARYYAQQGLLTREHNFVEVLMTQSRHSVWFPYPEEPGDYFGYSIGAYYLFNEPEILVIHEENLLSQQQLALTVNYVRSAHQLKHPVVDGTRIKDIIQYFPIEKRQLYEPFSECKFHTVSESIKRNYLGFCMWFHCNFMDTLEFPALYCVLEPHPRDNPVPAAVMKQSPPATKWSFAKIFFVTVLLVVLFPTIRDFLRSLVAQTT